MKSFLAFLVAMAIIVTLGDAGCLFKRLSPWRPYKGCEWNGKFYPFGHIEKTEDCLKCDCDKYGIICCSLYFTPVIYDKENCTIVFNKKRCDYDVVQKDDPSKECLSHLVRVG